MGTIRYRIIAGTLPVRVNLEGSSFPEKIHENYEEGSFLNIPAGNYTLSFIDATGCTYEEYINGIECAQYGVLYNFYAVSNPLLTSSDDWIVPSRAHWDALIAYYGGST